MEIIDIFIWTMAIISTFLVIKHSIELYKQTKENAKDCFNQRFYKKISIKNYSRISLQTRGSVRLFHYMTQNDLQAKYEELKELP